MCVCVCVCLFLSCSYNVVSISIQIEILFHDISRIQSQTEEMNREHSHKKREVAKIILLFCRCVGGRKTHTGTAAPNSFTTNHPSGVYALSMCVGWTDTMRTQEQSLTLITTS